MKMNIENYELAKTALMKETLDKLNDKNRRMSQEFREFLGYR